MNRQMPEKPKTMKGQIDTLWDIMNNHVLTSLKFQDMKCNFLLALSAINVALLGIVIAKLVS